MMKLTSMLQGHQHRLFNEVPLDKAAEVVTVHGEVGELEGADRSIQERLEATAPTHNGYMRACQRYNSRAGMRDSPGQPLLCKRTSIVLKSGHRLHNQLVYSCTRMFHY